jgi:hypothetical protein
MHFPVSFGFHLVICKLFLSSYWSAGFGTFLQAPALLSNWLEDFDECTPMAGKLTNETPITLSEAPAAGQQLLSLVKYTPLVTSNGSQK